MRRSLALLLLVVSACSRTAGLFEETEGFNAPPYAMAQSMGCTKDVIEDQWKNHRRERVVPGDYGCIAIARFGTAGALSPSNTEAAEYLSAEYYLGSRGTFRVMMRKWHDTPYARANYKNDIGQWIVVSTNG